MDTALSLATAVQGLRRLQMPKFDEIQNELQYARHSCEAVLLLDQIAPGSAPYIYSKAALIESHYDDIPDLFSLALEKINDKCPINIEHIEEQLLNYEGELYLMPEPQGFPYSLDELFEQLGYPDDLMDMPLEWFVVALGGSLEWEHLEILVERFPVWHISLEDFPGDGVLDWPKFKKALKRNGLEEFAAAFQVIWRDTGNIYLDFDPYSEDAWDWSMPDFGLEGVQHLVSEYLNAQPLLDGHREARERIGQEPEIYRKLVKIMKRCLKDTKQLGKTLLEVFTGDA